MSRAFTGVLSAAIAAMSVANAAAQDAGARAYVLDQGAQTLTAVDIGTGKTGQSAKLEGTPETLLRTANGQRMLVLDRGQGRDAGDAGYQAKTKSAVTIVDGRTLAVQSRVELCWGLQGPPMLSAAGDRLSVVCPGYRGKTPAESLPREIVTVDLQSGKVLSRLELTRPVSAHIATPDGRTGLVLSPREAPKKAPAQPAELRFVDLTTGAVAVTVTLEGDPAGPVLAPDGQFVYVLDRGKPSDNPDKNLNGKLHAISMSTHAIAAVTDVGSKPRGLVLDEQRRRLLLLSDGQPFKGPGNNERPGELRVVAGAAPAAPITVVNMPERVEQSADGKTLYVLGGLGVTRLSLPDLGPGPTVRAPRMGFPETAISADGRRGWLSEGESFTTYDLEAGTKIESVKTGRAGKKLLLGVESWAATENSKTDAQRKAEVEGRSYYTYTEYTVKPAKGALAIVPGDKAIYALNSMTEDVTVVDGQTGQVIKKVAAGGFDVLFMPSVSTAVVAGAGTVHAVDYTSHEKLAPLVTSTNAAFGQATLSPDAKLAVIRGTGGVAIINATSGKPLGTMLPFTRVVDVAIDWGR